MAILALASTEWTPDLSRAVGSDSLNNLAKRFKNDVFAPSEYKIFRDTLAHSADDSVPIYAFDLRFRRELIIRFHLFEIAELRGSL